MALAIAGITGSSGPCPASLAPNGPSGSSVSTRKAWMAGVFSVVGLLYSSSEGCLCRPCRETRPSVRGPRRPAESHVDRALGRAPGPQRVQRPADGVGDPHIVQRDPSRVLVERQL